MSNRSELLFQACGKISNPFVPCTLISKRTRQFIMNAKGNRSTAEILDYVLDELLAGALERETYRVMAEMDPETGKVIHLYTIEMCRGPGAEPGAPDEKNQLQVK